MPWWRHQLETFSALLAICAGNSPVTGEFPTLRPVTRSFDVFFDLRLNKWLSKQWWGWWSETPSCPLWRHSNDKFLDAFIFMLNSFKTIFTGVGQCTFRCLISHITQQEMVLNSLINHHMIMITCISYEIIFTISLSKLINIAPLQTCVTRVTDSIRHCNTDSSGLEWSNIKAFWY